MPKPMALPALIVPISFVAVSAVLVALQHRTRPQKGPGQAAGHVAHCRSLRRQGLVVGIRGWETFATNACSGGTGRAADPLRPQPLPTPLQPDFFPRRRYPTLELPWFQSRVQIKMLLLWTNMARRSSKIEANVRRVTQGCLHDISGDVLIQAWQDPDMRISSLKRVQTWKSQVSHS